MLKIAADEDDDDYDDDNEDDDDDVCAFLFCDFLFFLPFVLLYIFFKFSQPENNLNQQE